MHRCPQCDYAFGHLPGVPEDRFGAFTAAVTCPECAFEVPAGARLVVGSSVEAGAQPLTRARRNRQLLAALAPLGYLLFMSIEGIFEIASKWSTGARVWDFVKVAGLPMIGLVLWRAWVKWTPDAANDGRAPASFSERWLCVPGALVVFTGEPSGPAATGRTEGKRYEAADIRSIVVDSPFSRGHRWRAGDRAVAALTAHVWIRGRDGRRSDMGAVTVFVDTGAGSGAPGTDRTVALVEAGNRVARGVRASIGIGDSVQESAATGAAGDAPPALTIAGRLHAYGPWPQPANMLNLLFALPIAFASIAIGSWALLTLVIPATTRPTLPPALGIAAAVGAAVLPTAIPAWIVLLRRLRRRTLAGCRWEVGPHGIRVTEHHVTAKGAPLEDFTRDVDAGRIAAIEPRPRNGRVELVARGRGGDVLAQVSPDTLPDDGAEALAQGVRERVGCAPPHRGRPTP
jgi:hypothetical protein